MKFYLFSKIEFEVPNPIYLIECYCYQSDFCSKYDVIKDRKIEDVNKMLFSTENSPIFQLKKAKWSLF